MRRKYVACSTARLLEALYRRIALLGSVSLLPSPAIERTRQVA